MAKRRAKGEGGLFRVKGSRLCRAHYIHNGKVIRVSTEESVKQKALSVLQRLMADTARGFPPLPDAHKIRYADLRRRLIADYEAKGNRSLTTTADSEAYINGLTKTFQKRLPSWSGSTSAAYPSLMSATHSWAFSQIAISVLKPTTISRFATG